MRNALIALLSLLIISVCLIFVNRIEGYSQETDKDKELPKPYYKFEVAVTNVDVFVEDKYGEPIPGLRHENFQIYDNGVMQKISNFYEVKGKDIYISQPDQEGKLRLSESPLKLEDFFEGERTKIIFYFDNLQMHPLNKNWIVKKLDNFIKSNFSSNLYEGMVVSADDKLRIMQEFTVDSEELLQGINEVAQQSSDIMLRIRAREDLKEDINKIIENKENYDNFENMERALGLAQNYVEDVDNDIRISLKYLDSLINFLSGVKGRKVIIYISDGLPLNPAEEVYSYIDRAFPQGNALSKAIDYDATRLFKEITLRSNAYNVSIYTINAMGLESSMVTADKRTEWDVYSKGFGMMRNQSRFQNAGLQLMAEDTGGLAIVNANNIENGLIKISKGLSNYYSIGFASKNKDNKVRNLEVKVVGLKQDYKVRYRRNYKLFSTEEKIEDTVMSRLFLRLNENTLNISAMLMIKERGFMQKKELPLTIKLLIPLKNIMLLKKDGEHVGEIEVYFAVKDSESNISPCYKLEHEIKIPVADYGKAIVSNYPYLVDTQLAPDNYIFSLAIRDKLANQISYIQFEKLIK